MRNAGSRSLVVLMGLVGAVGAPAARADAPAGIARCGHTIDAATRSAVLDAAARTLRALYVFPDRATAMAEALARHRARGVYDALTNGGDFAALLTRHLRAVSADPHLGLRFSPVPLPRAAAAPSPEALARHRRQMARTNYGFERVEVLPRNVGYLKLDLFANPEACGATAAAAMAFLQNVDALVVDLRENRGGDPRTVALLCSYLFAQPTHLNDVWSRPTGETTQYWTLAYVPGQRLAEQPVYVLTSARTFSGAEAFAYDLKAQGRAKIVGEKTAGGAHMTRGERLDERFTLAVPFARAVNPVTKTNWEGTGVVPDVLVPAANALPAALAIAAADLARGRMPPDVCDA